MNPLLSLLGRVPTLPQRNAEVAEQLANPAPTRGSTTPRKRKNKKQCQTTKTEASGNRDQASIPGSAQEEATPGGQQSKKQRLNTKTKASDKTSETRCSYAAAWETYIDGNIVSESSKRIISNLLAATAAIKDEDSDDSSEDSDAEQWQGLDFRAGNMDLVQKTLHGMVARSSDEGTKAIGRHQQTIRLGRALWQSPALEASVTARMNEVTFKKGHFPDQKNIKAALLQAKSPAEDRPAPFAGKTQPYVTLSVTNYQKRVEDWLDGVMLEKEKPTTEQFNVLRTIADRILTEFRLEKEGRKGEDRPLLGFCHGPPGTGKSRAIKWIRRLFLEAVGWKHEDEFLCVAFQNRVAHAMEGTTLHSGGDVGIGGQRSLEKNEIDRLYSRNQYLRWIIIDELPMVSDNLLGCFEHHLADAAAATMHRKKHDKSVRLFGGYNVIGFGDFYQIPPIPPTDSLTIPVLEKKTEHARRALDFLWGDGDDSLNYFIELTVQKRIDDSWYSAVMEECRFGRLSHESYHFLVGLPTEHAGSWR